MILFSKAFGHRNTAHLVKKQITDKNGVRKMVYVLPDGRRVVEKEKGAGLLAKIISFLGLKGGAEFDAKIKADFQKERISERFGVDHAEYRAHVVEYFRNWQRWNDRLAGLRAKEMRSGKPSGEKKPSAPRVRAERIAVDATKKAKFDPELMRTIARLYGVPAGTGKGGRFQGRQTAEGGQTGGGKATGGDISFDVDAMDREAAQSGDKTAPDDSPAGAEARIEQISTELKAVEASILANPARKLAPYANRNGELPEILGTGGKYATFGDSIYDELGFEDENHAKDEYSKYLADRAKADRLKQDLEIAKGERLAPAEKDGVIHSKSFLDWFGDWRKGTGSKVVDKAGKPDEQYGSGVPVKVYHGTPSGGFKSFDLDKAKDGLFGAGFYFTADEDVAKEYALPSAGKSAKIRKGDLAAFVVPEKDRPRFGSLFDETIEWYRSDIKDLQKQIEKARQGNDAELLAAKRKAVVGELQEIKKIESQKQKFMGSGKLSDAVRAERDDDDVSGPDLKRVAKVAIKIGIDVMKAVPGAEVKQVFLNIRNPKDLDDVPSKAEVDKVIKWVSRSTKGQDGFYYKHLMDEFYDLNDKNSLTYKTLKKHGAPVDGIGVGSADDVFSILAAMKELHGKTVEYYGETRTYDFKMPGVLEGKPTWQAVYHVLTDTGWSGNSKRLLNNYFQQVGGHDGFHHTGGWNIGDRDHSVWIAFDPKQIKATTAEKFDATSDDIYKAENQAGRKKMILLFKAHGKKDIAKLQKRAIVNKLGHQTHVYVKVGDDDKKTVKRKSVVDTILEFFGMKSIDDVAERIHSDYEKHNIRESLGVSHGEWAAHVKEYFANRAHYDALLKNPTPADKPKEVKRKGEKAPAKPGKDREDDGDGKEKTPREVKPKGDKPAQGGQKGIRMDVMRKVAELYGGKNGKTEESESDRKVREGVEFEEKIKTASKDFKEQIKKVDGFELNQHDQKMHYYVKGTKDKHDTLNVVLSVARVHVGAQKFEIKYRLGWVITYQDNHGSKNSVGDERFFDNPAAAIDAAKEKIKWYNDDRGIGKTKESDDVDFSVDAGDEPAPEQKKASGSVKPQVKTGVGYTITNIGKISAMSTDKMFKEFISEASDSRYAFVDYKDDKYWSTTQVLLPISFEMTDAQKKVVDEQNQKKTKPNISVILGANQKDSGNPVGVVNVPGRKGGADNTLAIKFENDDKSKSSVSEITIDNLRKIATAAGVDDISQLSFHSFAGSTTAPIKVTGGNLTNERPAVVMPVRRAEDHHGEQLIDDSKDNFFDDIQILVNRKSENKSSSKAPQTEKMPVDEIAGGDKELKSKLNALRDTAEKNIAKGLSQTKIEFNLRGDAFSLDTGVAYHYQTDSGESGYIIGDGKESHIFQKNSDGKYERFQTQYSPTGKSLRTAKDIINEMSIKVPADVSASKTMTKIKKQLKKEEKPGDLMVYLPDRDVFSTKYLIVKPSPQMAKEMKRNSFINNSADVNPDAVLKQKKDAVATNYVGTQLVHTHEGMQKVHVYKKADGELIAILNDNLRAIYDIAGEKIVHPKNAKVLVQDDKKPAFIEMPNGSTAVLMPVLKFRGREFGEAPEAPINKSYNRLVAKVVNRRQAILAKSTGVDEYLWKQAKAKVKRSEYPSDDAYYAVVSTVYKNMGGKWKKAKPEK